MSIQNVVTDLPGEVGVNPRIVRIQCNDSFATITTAGYLDQATAMGYSCLPTDVFFITYLNNTFGEFIPNISGSTITLAPAQIGDVTLPVVANNLAKFSGTTGLIADSGVAPSDATKAKVASVNGATVIGEVATFSDIVGTVASSGTALSALQLSAKIIAQELSWAGGGVSNAFTLTGVTAASIITLTMQATTNPASILTFVPGTDQVTITFSADPGAVVVHAIALTVAQ